MNQQNINRETQRQFEGNRPELNRDINRGNINNVNRANVMNRGDINVYNNRNTMVRRNNLNTYTRPPYVWNGNRFYGYRPYGFHAYRPYSWGASWHPWGYFVGGALAATAIAVAVGGNNYYADNGVWYAPTEGGYTVVQAPVGGTVQSMPSGAQPVSVNNTTNYYYGGAYYEKSANGYTVVAPPAGAVVDNLPDGAQAVQMGSQTFYKLGETYYQPVIIDGQNKFEVVQVEQGQ
jgi:hypothetical protein